TGAQVSGARGRTYQTGTHSYLCTTSGTWTAASSAGWPTTIGTSFSPSGSSAVLQCIETVPALFVPAASGAMVGAAHVLDSGNPLDRATELAAQIGYVLRQRWISDQSAWRLVLEEPEREGTAPVLTLGPHDYEALTGITQRTPDVRN